MKVAVVTQWFPPEKAAIPADIAAGLTELGHEVTVVTGFPNYPAGEIFPGWSQVPRRDEAGDGYRVRRVALYPSHDRSVVRRAINYVSFGLTSTMFGWRLLREADVVYVYHPPLTAAAGPWLSRTLRGAPYVLHVQDLWPESVVGAGMLGSRAARVAERFLRSACHAAYRRAGAIVAIAPTMAAMLEARGIAADKLHTVANWADERIFFPQERDEATVDTLGLRGAFSVMFAGNLGDLQGLETAVQAAARVADIPDFRLILVGQGLAEPSLRALVAQLGAGNVIFHPAQPVDAMNAITAAADVHLVCLRALPFFEGTIPSKLGTILASAKPVICAVGGDARRLVDEAGAGWGCAPEDVKELEQAFRAAYATPLPEREALGRAARRHYDEKLSRSSGVKRIETALVAAATSAREPRARRGRPRPSQAVDAELS